jgi:hypothetical protein
LEWSHQQRKAQAMNPPPVVKKLMKLKAEKEAMKKADDSQISAG